MISRGTTPTYILTLPDDIDLTTANHVIVTFSETNYKKIIEKKDDELTISEHEIQVYLTQEETLQFPVSAILVQVNFTFNEGGKMKRLATTIERTHSARNLIEEVIS